MVSPAREARPRERGREGGETEGKRESEEKQVPQAPRGQLRLLGPESQHPTTLEPSCLAGPAAEASIHHRRPSYRLTDGA